MIDPHHASAILGLLAETSIHAGAGQSVGAIDLPIQREAHTDWPCVFGSAVKGALRTLAEDTFCVEAADPQTAKSKRICREELYAVFGPETGNASDHAGSLMVSDARLALLPVRSLTTHFKWVTCPAVLGRLARDAKRLGIRGFEKLSKVSEPEGSSDGLSPAWSTAEETDLYLEEYRFQSKKLPNSENVVKALACLSKREGFFQALARQLVVVEDDLFAHLCRHGTPVTAHVRLDSQTKTVASRGLWYEETLPPETLLYVALSASRARRRVKDDQGKDLGPMPMSASKVLQVVTGELLGQHPYLQLGGNETLGMGWCRVTPIEAS